MTTLRTAAARLALAVVAGLGLTVLAAAPAYAADDRIDSFDIAYDLQPSGVLRVTETIEWRFGDDSGRHGIQRDLVTREPYGSSGDDVVYTIENLSVSSPDPVATDVSTRTTEDQGGRAAYLNVRIGSPNETVRAPTATYVIRYDVRGAMRSFAGYDELFWDATGFGWTAPQRQVSISARVPGGAEEVTCFAGPPESTTTCPVARVSGDGVATFEAGDLAVGEGVSIGVKVGSGLVADNQPHLEPDASQLSPAERTAAVAYGGVSLASLVGAPLLGVLWWRRNGRDDRYAGLAPGTLPLPGQTAAVVRHDPDLPIPVAFAPPKIPVAEAGLLVDGQVDTRETAATIIDLAVQGAVQVVSTGEDDFRVRLLDPKRVAAPHETVLLSHLFGGAPPGAIVDVSAQGSLLPAHRALQTSVINQVAARGWFHQVPSAPAVGSLGIGGLAVLGFVAFSIGAPALLLAVPLLPIVVTLVVIRAKLRRGRRTAAGRAVCDQVEGFRTYLATAEADQLRFEEGEDIFSRYLPWAIVFELADRWADICRDLVAMGRIPDVTPYWFAGNYNVLFFHTGALTGGLSTAATPVPATSGSSGTGFGGGSSFGGGGFSGGGGGGGGGGSW